MRKKHYRWPFLCLCAQVASKEEVFPNTCRLDESIKVAVSLQTCDSWQTNVAGPKKPQAYVVVAKTNILIPDRMMVRSCDLKRKWLRVPDSMIVGDVSLTENYAVVATSEHPIPDCVIVRSLILKENRMSTS